MRYQFHILPLILFIARSSSGAQYSAIEDTTDLNKPADGIVFVNDKYKRVNTHDTTVISIHTVLEDAAVADVKLDARGGIFYSTKMPGNRVVYAPTGPLNTDIADSRSIYDAAFKGFNLAVKAGIKKPILVIGEMSTATNNQPWVKKQYKELNALLGALYALYMPLELREIAGHESKKYEKLYVYKFTEGLASKAEAIEEGRWISRDICGADPERMNPEKFEEYLNKITNLKPSVVQITEDKYPLISVVNRASSNIPRFNARLVKFEYKAPGATKTLHLIGKATTFNTGGLDLRTGDLQVGMSREKCGAAAIVGFVTTARLLNANININAKFAILRNNIGARGFVPDEIIKAKSGKRIRLTNTNAEGRMVLADLLSETKDEIMKNPASIANQHIYTVATLTGHVMRCYKFITGIMDNGPAASDNNAKKLQDAGNLVADLGEISVIRTEDYSANFAKLITEDLVQSPLARTTSTKRGHQIAMAFMMQASGLDQHGIDKPLNQQIKYTHLDVKGSAGIIDYVPTASPLVMLSKMYLLPTF